MSKKESLRNFRRMSTFEQKERFMLRNGIEYRVNRYHNVTVYADDGTLQLFPIIE